MLPDDTTQENEEGYDIPADDIPIGSGFTSEVTYNPKSKKYRAMEDLARIVGTGANAYRQDIRRIRKAESLRGAAKWAAKHSIGKRKYTAVEEDIDNDGIKDILVKAADGSLVIVNGYTVRRSDYPYRQRFGELSDEVRKQYNNYKKYLAGEEYGIPTRNEKSGKLEGWKRDPEKDEFYRALSDGGFRTYKPRPIEPTTYQRFCNEVVRPQIEELFRNMTEYYQIGTIRSPDGTERPKFPNVLLAVAADAWNFGVIRPALATFFKAKIPGNISPEDLKEYCSEPDIAKFKKREQFKEFAAQLVEKYVNNDNSIKRLIEQLVVRVPEVVDHVAQLMKQ